jgi:hypothetical protein
MIVLMKRIQQTSTNIYYLVSQGVQHPGWYRFALTRRATVILLQPLRPRG